VYLSIRVILLLSGDWNDRACKRKLPRQSGYQERRPRHHQALYRCWLTEVGVWALSYGQSPCHRRSCCRTV